MVQERVVTSELFAAREWARARVEARIDLDALRANVRTLAKRAEAAELMVVVKANAYRARYGPVRACGA